MKQNIKNKPITVELASITHHNTKRIINTIFICCVILLFVGCAISGNSIPRNFGDRGKTLNENEAEIIIQRTNNYRAALVNMNVYVNDQYRLTLGNNDEGVIIVPNGTHTIFAEVPGILRSQRMTVRVNSDRTTFLVTPKFRNNSLEFTRTNTTQINLNKASETRTITQTTRTSSRRSRRQSAINDTSMQAALNRAFYRFPIGNSDAITFVTVVDASNNMISADIQDTIEQFLLNRRMWVMGRFTLDNTTDETARVLGRQARADYVVTAIERNGEINIRVLWVRGRRSHVTAEATAIRTR